MTRFSNQKGISHFGPLKGGFGFILGLILVLYFFVSLTSFGFSIFLVLIGDSSYSITSKSSYLSFYKLYSVIFFGAIQWCSVRSSIVGRILLSTVRHWCKKSTHSFETFFSTSGGSLILPDLMASTVSVVVLPLKGSPPVRSPKRITPVAQTSIRPSTL